ncbi:unnamed protein product [Ranitomeya imitator]|uniref:Helix-turn-helix domain-containing protein n=1 Tax=Ranitomeya imitator TaxID=111125 RepID=A0ABN9LQD0_9NEOB|nr:unnamed protein product [Ranitomeya imitator]
MTDCPAEFEVRPEVSYSYGVQATDYVPQFLLVIAYVVVAVFCTGDSCSNKMDYKAKEKVWLDQIEQACGEEEQSTLRILEELYAEHHTPINGKIPPSIRPKSKKFPPLSSCANVDLFVQMVTKDLMDIPRSITKDNLSRRERDCLQKLQQLPDVEFKPADKGGNIVVWPRSMYEKEVYRQLNDKVCYKKLTYNPLSTFRTQLQSIIDRAAEMEVITKELATALVVNEPTIPTLYLLPKVHKNSTVPPGRPIISGGGNFLEHVGRWIDSILQPCVESLPSFIKDTGAFLKLIDGIELDPGGPSSYSSKERLWGAAFAPSYANLFLGLWERDLSLSDPASSVDRVLLWTRYIDHVFMIWQGSTFSLQEFMSSLNDNSINIHITYHHDSHSVEFLDVLIKRDNANLLQTDIHRKSTSTNSLLHASSAHPRHVVQSVPTGQFLRLRRICSDTKDFERQADDLKKRFFQRGYSHRMVKKAYNRARYSSRHDLMYKSNAKLSDGKIRFVTDYHNQFPAVRAVLTKSWPILRMDPILSKYLPSRPTITTRRSRNLRDLLVHSHYVGNTKTTFLDQYPRKLGCTPCGHCVACPNVEKCNSFFNSERSRNFDIRKSINCTSRNVIYFATCPCGLIYIGLTTRPFKIRIREHVLGITAAAGILDPSGLKTIPRHFFLHHNCDATLLKIRGIDTIETNIRGGKISQHLAQLESRWIWRLGTLHPKGLNEQISFVPFL